jgi:DNA-binding LacI/PurR family transcriptional regulator
MAQTMKMADIAQLAGVSISTVSRALAGSPLVPEAKRQEILALAQARGYVVNEQARNLRLRKTRTISVVFLLGHEANQPISDPFFMELFGRLADEITARDHNILLIKAPKPQRDWHARIIQSQRSDGLLAIGQSDQHEALNQAARARVPMVVWGAHLPSQLYCSVGSDNIGGGLAATRRLIALGRRRIAFLGVNAVPEVRLRHEGYLRALAEAGIAPDPALIVPAHFTREAAHEAVRAMIAAGVTFDAIFAASDVIAMTAIKTLSAAGLRTPQDVSVIGFDDISMAAYMTPALTTVRQDLQRGAKVMVDLLFRRMAGEDTPSATMQTELVIRQSCGGEGPGETVGLAS